MVVVVVRVGKVVEGGVVEAKAVFFVAESGNAIAFESDNIIIMLSDNVS